MSRGSGVDAVAHDRIATGGDGGAGGRATHTRRRLQPVQPQLTGADDRLLFGANGALLAPHDERLSRRDSVRRKALALADMAGLAGAYAVMATLEPVPLTSVNRWAILGALPMWMVIHVVMGLYHRDANVIHKSSLDELPKLVNSLAIGTLLIFMVGEPILGFRAEPLQAAIFLAAALVLVPTLRSVARSGVRRSFEPERVAILGSGSVASVVARKLQAHPEYGVELVGVIDRPRGTPAAGSDPSLPPMLGAPEDIEAICGEHNLERLVIAFGSLPQSELVDLIRVSKQLQLKITVVPRLYEVIGHRVEIDEIEGMTMLGMRSIGRPRSSLLMKRAIDVLGAGAGLIVLAPLLLAIAVAVKVSSAGPVLYSQHRMGRSNRPFRMYKFRTMVAGADAMRDSLAHLNEMEGILFKIEHDPRVTRVGRFLRRTSLDELPQLWNVLRGEMSLVGPRPLIPDEDYHCIGWHRTRLELTPGLTGPWQVSGRNSVPFQEMVKMDYLYVAEWSLWNDMRLLLRTMPVVLFARGS